MADKTLRRWITINEYMDPQYRELLVKIALNHRESASTELRKMSAAAFSSIAIPGFRNFQKASASVALPYVVKQFQKKRDIAFAVLSLWSDAFQDLIMDVKRQAIQSGLSFQEPWTWKEAEIGFYGYDQIPELNAIIEPIADKKVKEEHDHWMLAELWLSAAIIDNSSDNSKETRPPLHQIESIEQQPSLNIQDVNTQNDSSPNNHIAKPGNNHGNFESELTSQPSIHENTQEQNGSDHKDEEWDALSLTEVFKIGEQIQESIKFSQSALSHLMQELGNAIQTDDLFLAQERMQELESKFDVWTKTFHQAESFVNYGVYRLEQEINLRPDITAIPLGERGRIEDIKSGFKQILEYDEKKTASINMLERLQSEFSTAENEWIEWVGTGKTAFESEKTSVSFSTSDHSEMTLALLMEEERQIRSYIAEMKYRTEQLRKACINKIRDHAQNLSGFIKDDAPVLFDGKPIDDVLTEDFSEWPGQSIRKLEIVLQDELNKLATKVEPGKLKDYATALTSEWSDEYFTNLLSTLTLDRRNPEVFLMLLGANLGRQKPEPLILSLDIFAALLDGLLSFSGKDEPFEFIGQVLPTLVSGYLMPDNVSTAEICMMGLAVHYNASYRLPDGLLWQMATEWPIDKMAGWNKIWQSALLGETYPIYTDNKQTELREKLAQSRSKVDKDFTRDGAHFIRLGSLQSFRHLGMMSRLLQSLVEKLEVIKKQDSVLSRARIEQLPDLVSKLREILQNEVYEFLSENSLAEMYEDGIRADKIDDSNPFHQRVSLRILNECAISIKEYGDALLELWDLIVQRLNGLDSETLLSELAVVSNFSNLGKTAAELVIRSEHRVQQVWDDRVHFEELSHRLVIELLRQPIFTIRIPRVVCHVAKHTLTWSDLLNEMLQDCATPLSTSEAADYLLENKVSDQVLHLVQYISLDHQNRAQSLRTENERLCDQLTLDILNLGGKTDDLNKMREVGRWGWLIEELRKRIESYRSIADAESKEVENRSRAFRKMIQELDDAIFDTKGQIPHDIFELVEHGLAIARRAYSNKDLFPALDEYLREIQYRLTHNSWPIAQIQQITEQLENALSGEKDVAGTGLNADRVLELLERGELEALGLSKIDQSEANTRINVLSNWLKLRKMRSIFSAELLQSEVLAIQSLFSYFARMMSMTRFKTQNGKSLDSLTPIIFEYWEMRYPRTNALDNQYVFITIPGDSPSTKDLQNIENIFEEKEFLEYYFVILFVPGCTEKIYKRLQRKGLVIIDETRLVSMLLAEANNNRPLGVLRPMVLTAIDANADIFITNQSVNARTSIFVGRDNLVDRIANSGDNYALYGGRRIGKSSVLKSIEQRLEKRGYRVAAFSLEGEKEFGDEYISTRLAQMLGVDSVMAETGSFKQALISFLENDPDLKLAILLDEIDRYIVVNSERHTLIEALRTCSDRFGNRFRVIIAGFMNLYDCLHGMGPYTPNSDPWQRMFTDNRELENLTPTSAEEIVREGFVSILGWKFDHWAIPQRIVERTGGHPAFVQAFCLKLLERVRARKDQNIQLSDVEAVFNDPDPRNSFIAYVRDTLNLNLEPVSHYLIIWLAADSGDTPGFTMDKIRYIAGMSRVEIPEERLRRSLDLLKVTSVIRERMPNVFDFTVPDYASILNRLGNTSHMDTLEDKLRDALN